MKKNNNQQFKQSAGFTVVELMIATVVFSTILIAVTFGVMHFSALYYKSVYTSETQNVARDISDQVANAVRFGTNTVIPSQTSESSDDVSFCAGGYIFVTTVGQQYSGTNTGFYRQPVNGNCTIPGAGDTDGRKQLLAKNMRITAVSLTSVSSNLYTFRVTIAYGDDDLLTQTKGDDVHCISGAGNEYCAVSSLVTTIEKRI